jgi:ABC-type sugar transport system ATPase subunit
VAALGYAGVRKDYGEVTALRDLELEVGEGELLALVGPSGSGKSTALRLAAGLEDVSAGSISIGGRDVTRLPPAKRNVSMVFESYALFPHLSAAENIGFGLRARGLPRRELSGRVLEAATLTGCERLLERKPHQLSGGERQRVALARALARRPDVFLLDEPLSNLDAQLRVDTRAELKRLHQRLGATMVYVTHDQVEALTLGDRVAVLHEGTLQQLDAPDAVYRRPVNRFVARFIGSPSMNLLATEAEGELLHAGPFDIPRPRGLRARRLEAGIRPEHVELAGDGAGTPARVEVVERAGSETLVYLVADGVELVARASPDVRLTVGATMHVGVAARNVYLFDAETGETLASLE